MKEMFDDSFLLAVHWRFYTQPNVVKTDKMPQITLSFLKLEWPEIKKTATGASSHHLERVQAGRRGLAPGFNVADCVPMKKGTVSSVLIFNFVSVCVPSFCVQFVFPS